ncbi:MAG: lactonase family protein [Planctomyces sp.]|nr:lactonase family protein [Planctomyces sp.]
MSWILRCGVIMATALSLNDSVSHADDSRIPVFVSSFAPGEKGAIDALEFDLKTGQLHFRGRTGGMEHPFFMALSDDRRFLYAIHAPGDFGGKNNEYVSAYAHDQKTGSLKLLNRESALGTAACFLDVDATGKMVLVANYSTGSVASLPITADGSLKPAASFVQHVGSSVSEERQKAAHAHCFVISPDNRFALAADLGLDQILVYAIDPSSGQIKPAEQPFVRTLPGAGPRHLTFHPNGKDVYVINELANSVTHFSYQASDGRLTERSTISTLPEDFKGTSYCADLKITPDGKHLFGTNRGHDSIAAYRINSDGTLEHLANVPSRGAGPQNLAITPDGQWLLCANMPGNSLAVFRIQDAKKGPLNPVHEPFEITSPSCIMLP